ncbi:MAG: ATPase [Candidatus Eisenbacteria bacterium]
MRLRPLVLAAACAAVCAFAVPTAGHAAVADSSAAGFLVHHEGVIHAPAADVYAALAKIGSWWDGNHSWSGQASNLSLDPRAGGCFCEKLPNGTVQHMTVVYADPGKQLRLSGGLGPLQGLAVSGAMTFALKGGDDGTRVTLDYMVGGYMPGGIGSLAHPVDGVLGIQFARFKRFVETGKPQ